MSFNVPSHEPEDVEVCPDAKNDDEQNEEECQRLQDPDHELGHTWKVSENVNKKACQKMLTIKHVEKKMDGVEGIFRRILKVPPANPRT